MLRETLGSPVLLLASIAIKSLCYVNLVLYINCAQLHELVLLSRMAQGAGFVLEVPVPLTLAQKKVPLKRSWYR